MNTKIVYALIADRKGFFLFETWASIYSLRIYEPDRFVCVCCDKETSEYIREYPELVKLINEIIVVPVPESYSNAQRSREIKTSVRKHVEGNLLFVDTDTIICGSLEYIDNLKCDVAAVPEFHMHLNNSLYRDKYISSVKNFFGDDICDASCQFNSGVIYAADTPRAHELYERWHNNWYESAIQTGVNKRTADQPPLTKSDKDMGYIIEELPGEYNCQMALSVKHFHEARIIHFIHFGLLPIPDNSFLDRSIYKQIKDDGGITETTARLIRHCKSAFVTPSAIIDGKAIDFLLSNPGHVFLSIYKNGGWMLSLMNKIASVFARILHKKGISVW